MRDNLLPLATQSAQLASQCQQLRRQLWTRLMGAVTTSAVVGVAATAASFSYPFHSSAVNHHHHHHHQQQQQQEVGCSSSSSSARPAVPAEGGSSSTGFRVI